MTTRPLRHFWRYLLVFFLLAAAGGILLLLGTTWWINFSEQPVKSDIIVVLGGDFRRELYAADLFKEGFAPEIWASRTFPSSEIQSVRNLGISYPLEETVDREILTKKNVPQDRIHLYGHDANSTVDEAKALRQEYDFKGKKILIVTSQFHARRSRLIFRHYLPGAEVHVVATPYAPFYRRWWRHKELANDAIIEIFKLAYYVAGMKFVRQP